MALTLLASLFVQHSFAQNYSTLWLANANTTGATQVPLSLGNFSSPTTTPSYLFVTGDVSSTGSLEIRANRYKSNLSFTRYDPGGIYNIMTLTGGTGSATQTAFTLFNSSNQSSVFLTTQGTSYLMGGSLCIGTTNPGSSQLAVEGLIECQKVTVTLANPFPDYVFQPGYSLPSLDSVSNYINTHHHLAEVPTADNVAKNGFDLGGNQAVLLKKIEEVTLYLIAQNKEIQQLKRQNEALQARNQTLEELERRIQRLEDQARH